MKGDALDYAAIAHALSTRLGSAKVSTSRSDLEATSFGAALMAGLGHGIWRSEHEAFSFNRKRTVFSPRIDADTRERQYAHWKRAIERSRGWSRA